MVATSSWNRKPIVLGAPSHYRHWPESLRRQVHQLERLAAGADRQDWNLVFTSLRGTPLDAKNVTHRFQAMLEAPGIASDAIPRFAACLRDAVARSGGPSRGS